MVERVSSYVIICFNGSSYSVLSLMICAFLLNVVHTDWLVYMNFLSRLHIIPLVINASGKKYFNI